MVDGAPFLVIGGELHNSSSSSLDYMQPLWSRLLDFNLNTALAAVAWELIEPQEGVFDFALLDGLLREARAHGLRLILLWFGSWKNGTSSYAPTWVKRDYQRFPRVRLQGGHTIEVLSTLAEANVQADAKAFAALMRHLREVDANDHTVIMIQVENEVGVLGDSRDRSALADRAFANPVPRRLIDHLLQYRAELGESLRRRWELNGCAESGSWAQLFGGGSETDEFFMAWHYARYIDTVAAAGKAEYDIPMYVNAWLCDAQHRPGDWPSGGPLPHVLDLWRAAAPHIDMLAPDIYQTNFTDWCARYTQRANPLFIPEMRRDEDGPRNVFCAVGEYGAIGVSPFGIDSLDPQAAGAALRSSYTLLRQMAPSILAHQGRDEITGFVLDAQHPAITRELGGYELEISLDNLFGFAAEQGYGLVIATAPDEFIGAGYGFRVAFRPKTPGAARAGIAAVDEGEYRAGQWVPLRRLNGDETWGGDYWRFPPAQLNGHASGVYVLGAGTGISRCSVYRYE
jgi:hypothetical protein